MTLLLQDSYQKSGKIAFETYYKLFVQIRNQLSKQEANALVMAKLIRLTNSISEIPSEHKQTFYDEYGAVIK